MRLTTALPPRYHPHPPPPSKALPLSDGEFTALMVPLGPFERGPRIAVAVSGGPDSLALMLLASRWARALGGQAIGLTVDHGLRPTSSDEARTTGRWLTAFGIDHQILRWTADKPATGIPKQARDARYDLLTSWCRQAGVLHLLVAHHREDQAETVAIRQARQSGRDGLAGMATVREMKGLRLLRPLLDTAKARLIASLEDIEQPYIVDPSNDNQAFTRNRLRRHGLDLSTLIDQASRNGQQRRLSDDRLQRALIQAVKISPIGIAMIARPALAMMLPDLAERLMIRVLMTIGGLVYPPRNAGLHPLLEAMRAEPLFNGRTLARCRIVRRRDHWLVCREKDAKPWSMAIDGKDRLWDGRFSVCYRQNSTDLVIKQLGDDLSGRGNLLPRRGKSQPIPSIAKPSLPALWHDGQLIAIPHLNAFDDRWDWSALNLAFRPRTPLANAPFAAHMCRSEKRNDRPAT